MGRTARTRQRLQHRKCNRPLKLDSHQEFIELKKWMILNGWKPLSCLCPAVFHTTGRGLMATSNLVSNQLIIQIPRNLLITKEKVLAYIPELIQYQLTSAECLTFFLLKSKEDRLYKAYISTLPSRFSVGELCGSNEVAILPVDIQNQIIFRQHYVFQKYKNFVELWKRIYDSTLALDLFQWAWYCVNTRAVFYQDTHQFNSGENNMALAPYLDMFNHSPNVDITAGFNKASQCYEICSKQSIKKYEQVFINYGAHDNQTLFLEYGFLTNKNMHDVVIFSEKCLLDQLPPETFFTPKKIEFFKQLPRNSLFCAPDGFSWNAQLAMTILFSNDSQLLNSHSLFQIIPSKTEKIMLLGLKIIEVLKEEYRKNVDFANQVLLPTPSFCVAKLLIQGFLTILETCASSWIQSCEV